MTADVHLEKKQTFLFPDPRLSFLCLNLNLNRLQLGGFAFIGEGIPIGLGAAFQVAYRKVRRLLSSGKMPLALDALQNVVVFT